MVLTSCATSTARTWRRSRDPFRGGASGTRPAPPVRRRGAFDAAKRIPDGRRTPEIAGDGALTGVGQPALFSDADNERRQARRMRGKKEIVKVAVGRPEDVVPRYHEREATVYGPLALMPTVVWDGWEGRHEGWTITHVNTGYAIGGSIADRDEALRVIFLLKDDDWSFVHKAHVPEDLREKTLRLLREAGAS